MPQLVPYDTERDAPLHDPFIDWTARLNKTKGGKVKPTIGNAVLFLRCHDEFAGTLAYDEMQLRVDWSGAPLDDAALSRLQIALEKERSRSPVAEWLRTLHWDGVPRLATLAERTLGTTSELEAEVVYRWCVSAVARALQPGCKADAILVLLGTQGARKSSWLRALGDPWFADSQLDFESKDSVLQCRAAWIYELAEIDGITTRRDADRVKAFATVRSDELRAPYARTVSRYPRHFIFAGSTNRDDFLNDSTGSRRFWIANTTDRIDVATVVAEREQLFAEATVAYNDGVPWWLDAESDALREDAARNHFVSDPWQERVRDWLVRRELEALAQPATAAEIMSGALGLEARDQTPATAARLAIVLASLGYEQSRERRTDGSRRRVYIRCAR